MPAIAAVPDVVDIGARDGRSRRGSGERESIRWRNCGKKRARRDGNKHALLKSFYHEVLLNDDTTSLIFSSS
jgi:hypothetical protein